MTKICTNKNCQQEKDISQFRKNKNTKDGYEGQCKECRKKKQKESYKEQNWNEKKQERRRLNPKQAKEYAEKWRNNNREKYRSYDLSFRKRKNPILSMYENTKDRAKRKGIEFNIEITDIIIPEKCPIFNIPLSTEIGKGYDYKNKSSRPSLDRIDNSKGYVKGNVWVISSLANTMKNNASPEELKTFCVNFLKQIDNGLFK